MNHFPLTSNKSGISLIAVLMFMLAATTASIVVFRYVSQEGFSSAARLKNSEAYRASQAGLEAVQGWLTNKGADAGELIRTYENEKRPVLMCVNGDCENKNLLGGMTSNRNQKFEVYLAGVETSKPTYKLKFISVGTARDGSKYSQAAIFNVDGLYKMNVKSPSIPKPQKVPPFFGGVGDGTQGIVSSGYVIGNLSTTSGFSTYGDLIVTGNYTMSSGAQIGCPLKPNGTRYNASNDTRPTDYDNLITADPDYFGNAYVKENLVTQQAGYCGSLYVDGNMLVGGEVKIWGDLYVKGNLTLNQKIHVYGNVTVGGNIKGTADMNGSTFYKNFSLPSTSSTFSTNNYKIDVKGTTCKVGSTTPPVTGAIITKSDCSEYNAKLLDYLGDQISTNKVDENYNQCTSGSNCIYRIPDPIVLGFATDWKQTTLPSSGCTTLKNFASNDNTITLSNSVDSKNFIEAVNNCHNNGTVGNWEDANGKKWLVLRLRYDSNGGPNGIENQILGTSSGGNFIIVIHGKPSQNAVIRPPLTTEKTNVLLYLTEGASTIQLSPGSYRNYFIYSEKDIDEINGSQYLRGNLFMANGSKVVKMQDPTIESNDALFDALSEAGIIKFNDKCSITKGGCGNNSEESSSSSGGFFDNDIYHVPLAPHLKVALQSQYANEESVANPAYAVPAILVLPRIIYVQQNSSITKQNFLNPNQNPKYYNILYLNNAKKSASMETVTCTTDKGNCDNHIPADLGAYKFIVTTPTNPDCPGCGSTFYVIVSTGPSSGYAMPPISPSSSSVNPSGGSSGSSSSRSSGSSSSSSSGSSSGSSLVFSCNISGSYTVGTGGGNCVNVNPPEFNHCTSPDGVEFRTTSNTGPIIASWGIGAPNSFCNAETNIKIFGNCNAYKECGSISINKPSCRLNALTGTSPKIASGATITPTVSCGGGATLGNIDANSFVSNDCHWTGSGTGGKFTRNSTGNCTLRLNNLKCGNTNLENMDYPCYTGTSGENEDVTVEVSGGTACAYQPEWCNDMLFNEVTSVKPSTGGSSSKERCIFLQSITGLFNIGNAKINGNECSYMKPSDNNYCSFSNASGFDNAKKDGGYYLYIPAYGYVNDLTATGNIEPSCNVGGGGTQSSSSGGSGVLGCRYCWNSNYNSNNRDYCEYSQNENCILITTSQCPTNSSRKNCPEPLGCCNWDFPDQTKNCWRLDMNNSADCPNLLTPGIACPAGGGACPAVSWSVCDYNPDWCGGKAFDDVIYNSKTRPTTPGTCMFLSNYTKITTASTGGEILINGVSCSGNTADCQKPDLKDGGYYLYLKSGTTSSNTANWAGVVGGAKPNCTGSGGGGSSSSVPSSSSSAPSSSSSARSSSSAAPTITCNVAKTSVTQGENIGPPTISCSSGTLNKSNANFNATSGSLPQEVSNWKNTTGSINAYYGATVTGGNTIQVSNVICGSTTVNGNKDCGTITVNKPTCSGVSGNVTIGQTIAPTVSCGNATKSGNPTFSDGGIGGGGWNSNGSGGGSFNSAGNKTLSLASVTCDGHLISGITGQNCGSVTVVASSSSSNTLTCTGLPSTGTAGTAITQPTVQCNGSTVSSGITWTNAPTWSNPTAGTYNVSVSASSGTCSGKTASCGTLTVNASGGGGGGTIDLTNATQGWGEEFSAGTYTIIQGGKTQCRLQCANVACSISGVINGSGIAWGDIGQVSVSSGSVTITGTLKFNGCW